MTDPKEETNTSAPELKPGRVAGICSIWLVGIGALVFGTLPVSTVPTSLATNEHSQTVPQFKTPLLSGAQDNLRPAAGVTQAQLQSSAGFLPTGQGDTVDFIVRFNNNIEELDVCRSLFRSDPQASREMFTAWAGKYRALQDLSLKKASFSGEMILNWNPGMKRPPTRAEINTKLDQIKGLAEVRYADPDFHTAQPQKSR